VSEIAQPNPFQVTGWAHALGGLVERHKPTLLRLAALETRLLDEQLAGRPLRAPVYISGLARAGTTILLEILSRHPAVATHQYRDYPLILVPYWWDRLLRYMETKTAAPRTRAHGDRIQVTQHSPEAMEEAIWMAFFEHLHDQRVSNVLDRSTSNPAFAAFYREHIGKLLLARGAARYVSKANYNVTRFAYLQEVFPDARFVLPVRQPETHLVSLMRQHRRFCEGLADNPKGREHLRRVGHFEFGPERRAINTGPEGRAAGVAELWARGEEVRGWARYWASVHGFLAAQLARDDTLRCAVMVLRYEDLCAEPEATLAALFAHVELEPPAGLIEAYRGKLAAPSYYDQRLTDEEAAIVAEETAEVRRRFGY